MDSDQRAADLWARMVAESLPVDYAGVKTVRIPVLPWNDARCGDALLRAMPHAKVELVPGHPFHYVEVSNFEADTPVVVE